MQREIECHVQIKTNEGKAKTEMEVGGDCKSVEPTGQGEGDLGVQR